MPPAKRTPSSLLPSLVILLLLLASPLLPPAHTASAQAPLTQIDLPTPTGSVSFGARVLTLPNGNFVVTDPGWNDRRGAAYLYNGKTLEIISRIVGARRNSDIGQELWLLTNGNFVVHGQNQVYGAVTWGDANTGFVNGGGVVNERNSLVGSTPGDSIGNLGIVTLPNGNYLVRSPFWNNGNATSAGAVTWGNGATGSVGKVGAQNSLVGSSPYDRVGEQEIDVLSNGNYLVYAYTWDNGSIVNAGATTWGNGATGSAGVLSAANSLVGSMEEEQLGGFGAILLPNGNYLVNNPWRANGLSLAAGSLTWGDGTKGVAGVVSATNSFIGSGADETVGLPPNVTVLANGNYVVTNSRWDHNHRQNVGAVTWGNGATGGLVGEASPTNSLIGSNPDDNVGSGGVIALTNGNYVVYSHRWGTPGNPGVGAVTWGDGASGTTGVVSTANSLVASTFGDLDELAAVVLPLANGNYVVAAPFWRNGEIYQAGAVTWGNGEKGTTGIISPANSLVGIHPNDQVGQSVTALANGNYVIASPTSNSPEHLDAGAITWGNGEGGTTGAVSAANSLFGAQEYGYAGNEVVPLTNGNYVVHTHSWEYPDVPFGGMVTWANGDAPTTGFIRAANSLVGTTYADGIGVSGILPLANGNYLVISRNWDHADLADAGALTWGNGISGTVGVVGPANSLIGAYAQAFQNGDAVVHTLSNGDYLLVARDWTHGAIRWAGAVTWGNGAEGSAGKVNTTNSLLGTQEADHVGIGGIEELPNGDYLIHSPRWANREIANAGAITWVRSGSRATGAISPSNSIAGKQQASGNSMVAAWNAPLDYLLVGMPIENRVVLASFAAYPLKVQREGTGNGMVVSNGLTLLCGTQCSAILPKGLEIRLAALPAPYSVFVAWGGACAGITAPICEVAIDAAKTVTATFAPSNDPGAQTSHLPFVGGVAGEQ